MTLLEVSNQLYDLSLDGFFNHQKVTRDWVYDVLNTSLVRAGGNAKKHVLEIALPDGWWFATVYKFSNGEYDYSIPDTKEDNKAVLDSLWNSYSQA